MCNLLPPERFPNDSRVSHLLLISRIVWDHVVVPYVLGPEWPASAAPIIDHVRTFQVADALFPLVPRACRASLRVLTNYDEDEDMQHLCASRYVALKCAGRAASVRCLKWILMHEREATGGTTTPQRMKKDCLTVLRGLCYGGHVAMAQELVQTGSENASDTPTCWRGVPLSWPVNDPDLMDEIKDASGVAAKSLLCDACRGGNLESVKWVMSTFGVGREGWELVEPFHGAVTRGHIDVVEWLGSSTDVVNACITATKTSRWGMGNFFDTPSLEVVKRCTEWFYGQNRDPSVGGRILSAFIRGSSHDESQIEEGCQWIKDSFSVTEKYELYNCVRKEKAFKWVMKSFNLTPTVGDLLHALRNSESTEFLLWLSTFFSAASTSVDESTLIAACGNDKDSVSVVRALLPRGAPPTTQQLYRCLENALDHGNTAIADWLEKTFHVMASLNADPSEANSMLPCINSPQGAQWFLSNVALCNISKNAVHEAVEKDLNYCCFKTAFLKLDTFNLSFHPGLRFHAVGQVVLSADSSQVTQVLSHGNFTPQDVAEGLATGGVASGKVVRWLLNHFQLNDEQVKGCGRPLLSALLWRQKTNCAEWLIRKFNITLDEIPKVPIPLESDTILPLSSWKMLLRVYPEMNAVFIKKHLMALAMSSPLHIQATLRVVEGLTMADMVPDTNAKETRWLTSLWWMMSH
ncbi:hypothetical protein Pelo_4358 [Pelomyxa schiedti]|nr:hypothetical protein Pelo_4358 [Pelomyxa schiedti]